MNIIWDSSWSAQGTSSMYFPDTKSAIYVNAIGEVFFYYETQFSFSFSFDSQVIAQREIERAYS